MKQREVIPLKQGLDFKLTLPGSKSITNRAFLCAAFAEGKSVLRGCLESDDTAVMLEALRKLQIPISVSSELNVEDKSQNEFIIEGCGGQFKSGDFTFDLHNAGTATRFLTAAMCVREGATIITGDPRMKERPIKDLVDGLSQLGIEIGYLENEGYPPIKIQGFRIPAKGTGRQDSGFSEYLIRMSGSKSSQYFSAILMMAPLLDKPLRLEVDGDLVSKPYIDITLEVMKAFGVEVKNNNYQSFLVRPQKYQAADYEIEGDASAASYWQSMNFLHGGYLEFENLNIEKSIQGDAQYASVLNSQFPIPNSQLNTKSQIPNPIVNMNTMPDVAMTLAVTAPFVGGKTKIAGLSTLKIKETDRLVALENELSKLGIVVSTTGDSITVRSQDSGFRSQDLAVIETYNDHRMAMCFAVMGTKIPGIVIDNPGCTDKTYPNFWQDLERMYLSKKIELGNKNLVLTGMRGSGKSYFGKKIAALLNRDFIDLDEEIEKEVGMKISEIVEQKGWGHFRLIEQNICSKYADSENLIIATGGGVVLNEENMNNLKQNGVVAFIFADVSVLAERLSKNSGDRPSLTGRGMVDELQQVWKERRDLYLKYADVVWDDTSGQFLGKNLNSLFK